MGYQAVAQEIKNQIKKEGFVWVGQVMTENFLSSGVSINALKAGIGAVIAEGYTKYYFPAEPLGDNKYKSNVGIFPPATTYGEAYKLLKQSEPAINS